MGPRSLSHIVTVAVLIASGAAAEESKPSDVMVPDQPLLELGLPALDPAATGDVLDRLLSSVNVAFGLEIVPSSNPPPPIDFAQKPERTLVLNGVTVRKALDAVTAADPRYRWEEQDGRIIVRGSGASSVLETRLSAFTLTNASLDDSLKAIAAKLNPSTPPSLIMGGVVLGLGAPEKSAPEQRMRPSPLVGSATFDGGTLLDALNAVAQVHRVSWRVRYDAPQASADSASISLLRGGRFVTASSPHVARARSARHRNRILLPITGEIASMVGLYASRTGLQYGMETVPERVERRPSFGGQPLDLTGLSPPDALSRILAYDSRYEWFESSGIFNIRPRRSIIPRTALDREIDGFDATGERLEEVLLRFIVSLGGKPEGRGSGLGGDDAAETREKMTRALAKPLSLSTRRGATARDVLNALCRAEGTLSWHVQPQPDPTASLSSSRSSSIAPTAGTWGGTSESADGDP